MTSIKKSLLIGASSLALVLAASSASAYGGGGDETNIDIKKTDIDVTKIDDSFNKKTEVDVDLDLDNHSINGSFNKKEDNDVYIKKEDNDVYITKEDNDVYMKKTETNIDIDKDDHSINDSFNKKEYTKDSNNNKVITKGSFNTKTTTMDFDNRASHDDDQFVLIGKDVTASVLEGTVANNSVMLRMGNKGDIAGNFIGDYVQQNADGVNLNLQNVGSNSNNQQAVTIRADVYNTDTLSMGGATDTPDHGGGHGGGWGGGGGSWNR